MPLSVVRHSRRRAKELARGIGDNLQTKEDLKAQSDFPFFCEWVTRNTSKPLTQPAHMELWNELILTGKSTDDLECIAGDNLDLLSPRGSAKAQPLDEPVLTPNGWVNMGDIRIGDQVIACDGMPTKVTRVTPQGIKDNYRVTFTDGTFTYCSDEHLWNVRNLSGSDTKQYKTVTLNQIRTKVFVACPGGKPVYREAELGETPWLNSCGYAKFHIPVASPACFEPQNLPVDPYLLGVLIGDGNLTNLRELGLWEERAEAKTIPTQYLFSSIEQRTALLQGLMDTDGTVGTNKRGGGNISFCTTSEQLADGVIELVQSLGGIATRNKPQRNWYSVGDERRQSRTSYKIGIKLPKGIEPFRLTRKQQAYKPCTELTATRGIVNIERVGQAEMQCITVAHPEQLYLTRNYIVTHNSTYLGLLISWLIGKHAHAGKHLPILYISYNIEIARAKSASIKRIIESTEYQQIFPKVKRGFKWSDEYWAIDYDFAGISLVGREPFTICCAGLKGGITSKRSSLVVFDDIIKSSEDIENPDLREEMVNSWRTVIRPTMFQGGRAICLGTRFRGDDIHVTTFCPDGGWIQVEQQALLEDENGVPYSYWPDMWSTDYLLDLRDGPDGDPVAFSFQYQNKVMRVSQISLDPAWVQRKEPHWDLTKYDNLAIGLDLSSKTKQRNDFTVAILGGRIGNEFHILDISRGRWMGNLDKIHALMDMLSDWDIVRPGVDMAGNKAYLSTGIPVKVYGEDVQYQASLAGDWKTKVVQEWGIHELQYSLSSTRGMDLLTHFRGITGLFQNEMVYFNMFRPLGPVIDELINYGSAGHDDCVAAIVHLLRGLRKHTNIQSY